MSDSDNIFREVDEDLRREQIAAMWDKYGVYILACAALIIAVVGGYNGYKWWETKRAAENGQAYYEATRLMDQKKGAEAVDALAKLADNSGSGYRTLAQLRIAAAKAQDGHKAEAVALYEKIGQSGADPILRDFARLQAATLRVDEADQKEIKERLSGLNADTNPWRYSAKELLGLAAFRSGDVSESEKIFGQILSDPSVPAELRKRAEIMLALLVKTPKQASAAPSGEKGSQTQ
jgi:hypothetical protein